MIGKSGDPLRRNLIAGASRKGDVAAIRYGVFSDCTDRGKDAGDARTLCVHAYTNGALRARENR